MTDPAFDSARFRQVLGHFPTGVCIVSAFDDGVPVGMAIGSFFSVSLEPPLVGFCAGKASGSWARLKGAGQFCVSVLADDQEEVSRRFASKEEDKFAGLAWDRSPLGSPRLGGSLAWIDCRTDGLLDGGDHDIVIGAVHDLSVAREGHPLVFFRGGYAHLA
jgi:flavin reductase (DIM6/NTAB) family NADH-FMN oxidoreductase RutF